MYHVTEKNVKRKYVKIETCDYTVCMRFQPGHILNLFLRLNKSYINQQSFIFTESVDVQNKSTICEIDNRFIDNIFGTIEVKKFHSMKHTKLYC